MANKAGKRFLIFGAVLGIILALGAGEDDVILATFRRIRDQVESRVMELLATAP